MLGTQRRAQSPGSQAEAHEGRRHGPARRVRGAQAPPRRPGNLLLLGGLGLLGTRSEDNSFSKGYWRLWVAPHLRTHRLAGDVEEAAAPVEGLQGFGFRV